MNRKHFIIAASSALLNTAKGYQPELDEAGWPKTDFIEALYKDSMSAFKLLLPDTFSSLPLNIESVKWIGKKRPAGSEGEPHLWVSGPVSPGKLYGIIQVSKSGRLLSAGAHTGKIGNESPRQPSWEISKVIERSSAALNLIKWKIPDDMELGDINYTLDGLWYVNWHKSYSGYPEVKTDDPIDFLGVVLAENDTSVRLTRWIRGPAPVSLSPSISRSAAISIAAHSIPHIMNTSLYKSWMPQNLKPIALKAVELCVTVPNWLLNPSKFTMETERPITERRLCWHASFLLFRKEFMTSPVKGTVPKEIYGLIHVYVDAATGEIVGGNMEPLMGDGISLKFGNK